MTKIIHKILILLLCSSGIFAQEIQSADSLGQSVMQNTDADTTKMKKKSSEKIDWYLYRIDIRGNVQNFLDSCYYVQYRYRDHLAHNLTGWDDFFNLNHRFFLFDFLESAQPRFISAVNMLPHQTGLRLDGRIVSDPINGMFNTRYISPDILHSIEEDNSSNHPAGGYPVLSDELNLVRFKLRPDDPLTRIKYFEGDFGYTDLDITFARNFGKSFAIELGGYNRDYDPTRLRAQNYRAGFHKQFGGRIDYSLQFQKNQDETNFFNRIQNASNSHNSLRHDLSNDLVIWLNEEKSERWHLQAGYTHDRRTIDGVQDTNLFSRYRLYQYQVSADRNLILGGLEMLAGAAATHELVWGTSFPEKYADTRMTGRLMLKTPQLYYFSLRPNLGYAYQYGESLQLLPGMETRFRINAADVRINTYQSIRYPTRLERSVRLHDVRGNADLNAERLTNVSSQITLKPSGSFELKADLIWRTISNEIRFTGDSFRNDSRRSFTVLGAQGTWSFWYFMLKWGGQITEASVHVTPENSA
jgi:hypothetical protein